MNSKFQKKKISVIGAGAWGTTIANLLAKKDYKVSLWVYEKDLCQIISEKRENLRYLPGFQLSKNIAPYSDLELAVQGAKIIILVAPSQHVRGIFKALSSIVPEDTILVSASKGIENESLLTISQIFNQELPSLSSNNFVTLSGPSFAREMAEEKPSAMVVASQSKESSEYLQNLFTTPYLRLFTSNDVIGVELGGALKNVIAIAAGVSDGLESGNNARAALITRGLAEINRIGAVLGAKPQTLSGLSGIGDLILTCNGKLSRNRTIGLRIGRGESLDKIQKDMITVAEGIQTVKSAFSLVEKYNIPAAIIRETYLLIYKNKNPRQSMQDLLELPTTDEF